MTDTIISRMREAKEGSRELDSRVFEAVDPNFPKAATMLIEVAPGDFRFAIGMYSYADAPLYTTDLSAAVALCERVLPGWWWRIGTCCVSDDATIAPDYNSPEHGERLHREFPLTPHEDGCGGWLVDVDQRPPRSVALALTLAILIAKEGREP